MQFPHLYTLQPQTHRLPSRPSRTFIRLLLPSQPPRCRKKHYHKSQNNLLTAYPLASEHWRPKPQTANYHPLMNNGKISTEEQNGGAVRSNLPGNMVKKLRFLGLIVPRIWLVPRQLAVFWARQMEWNRVTGYLTLFVSSFFFLVCLSILAMGGGMLITCIHKCAFCTNTQNVKMVMSG